MGAVGRGSAASLALTRSRGAGRGYTVWVGVVQKEPTEWRCRDCGEVVTDRELAARLSKTRTRGDLDIVVGDAMLARQAILPGACLACGGGRMLVEAMPASKAVIDALSDRRSKRG
jgi:hypothetical protein